MRGVVLVLAAGMLVAGCTGSGAGPEMLVDHSSTPSAQIGPGSIHASTGPSLRPAEQHQSDQPQPAPSARPTDSPLAAVKPAPDGLSFDIHLEGQAGEWVMAYIPFDEPAKTFGYSVEAAVEAKPGEGVAVVQASFPQFMQRHDDERAPVTFNGDFLVVGDGKGPARKELSTSYQNIHAGSDQDRFEGFYFHASGTTAWVLDQRVQLLEKDGPIMNAGLLLRGNGTQGWETPMPSAAPGLQRGQFSFRQEVGAGWTSIYFLREKAQAADASAMARLLSYDVGLPGDFYWGSDTAYAYGLWGPPVSETHASSETYTNRVIGTRQAHAGIVWGSGNYTQTDTINRLFVIHMEGMDLGAIGLVDVLPEFTRF